MKNLTKLEPKAFASAKRDRLLDYERYESDCATPFSEDIPFVFQNLSGAEYIASRPKARISMAASSLAQDALDFLHVNFTAGDSIDALASFMPFVVESWESAARLDRVFQASDEHHGAVVAHASFHDDAGYFRALRLICFAYLLGCSQLVPRIKAVLDYGNSDRDCLIERLLQPFGLAIDPLPSDSTRELPYRNTIKIFDAPPDQRPALMKRYLEKWYEASRRECFHGTHKGSAVFLGYWSFESGAITYLLDIDDSSYRDHEFYPRDMVDYARSLPRPAALGGDGTGVDVTRLRCAANEACLRTGFWFTPAQIGSRRYFRQGDVMPSVGGDYGATIWQWDQNQDPPKL